MQSPPESKGPEAVCSMGFCPLSPVVKDPATLNLTQEGKAVTCFVALNLVPESQTGV